ncbi:unnamed protein product, partial [Mesorhabditis belari]|uniref:Uncharacterized protein n=1 Tax=Mesorhabditis belari TaxID=2138241 RepID=A0AAF3EQQ3_9BILA
MISRRNRVLFNKVTREYQDTVEKAEQSFVKKWREKDDPRPYPKKIRICNFEIYTWYTSLYPLERASGRRQLDMSFTEDDVQDKNTNEIKQEAISSSF